MSCDNLLFQKVFQILRDPLLIINAGGKVQAYNAALQKFLGAETSVHQAYLDCGDFWPERNQTLSALDEFASEFISCSGESFSVKLRAKPLQADLFLIRVLAGISKRETFNKFHHQRLETLGMLAGGVAHDFNNILAGVLGHVTYLKTILPANGPHVESLNAIEDGGKKASTITQQILNFSRLETAEKPVKVNLSELASRTFVLLKGAISPMFTLQCEVAPNLYVLGVEGGLAQIIVNLVINARDALRPQEGNILMRVALEPNRERLERAFERRALLPKNYIALTVTDNGMGMSAELIKRIFEPYFSTKKEKGTGLGLATVDAIVKALGGAIEVVSQEGKGTSVTVFLPEAKDGLLSDSPPKQHGKAAGGMRGGSERILIVDDEFPVRNVLCVSLEHLGYKVQVACSGLEAIERYSNSKEPVDLVILDMLMPQLSGEAVFQRLREINPKVRVLIISGYTSEEPVRRILEAGRSAFMQKPFTIDELSRKVRECLES